MKQSIVGKIILYTILGLFGFFYLILLSGSIYEAVVFPRSPQKVTLAQAVEMDLQNKPEFLFFDKARYVSITDSIWECASVKQAGFDTPYSDKRHTDAVFTDSKKSAVVFVQVNGFFSCQDLQENEISGELQRFDNRPVAYQSDTTGTTTIDTESKVITFSLCTHCTPSEAYIFPVFFLLFPFTMWGIFAYGKRQQQKQNIG